jgi:hypothetical protein
MSISAAVTGAEDGSREFAAAPRSSAPHRKDSERAVRFYERRGFRLVSDEEKERLLKRYWSIPQRQIEESAVLSR